MLRNVSGFFLTTQFLHARFSHHILTRIRSAEELTHNDYSQVQQYENMLTSL